jgi:ABC-type multidrug transport system ATPase subunit
MNDPKIIFMDEPTSGLDSFTALVVMGVAKREAKKGRLVILSIHQPSFELLKTIDQVIVLNQGQNVYQGPPDSLVHGLENVLSLSFDKDSNPLDNLLRIINPNVTPEANDYLRKIQAYDR